MEETKRIDVKKMRDEVKQDEVALMRQDNNERSMLAMSFSETERLAATLVQSGYLSEAKDVAQAVAKIIAGREMGFGPMSSLMGIYFVQGKLNLSANLMAAAVKRSGSGYDYRVLQHTDDICEIAFYQHGKEIGRSKFDLEDAKKAGLLKGVNWQKYPRNMMFARAMSNGMKWYCPDALGGSPVYTPDEFDIEVDSDGSPKNIKDVEAKVRTPSIPMSKPLIRKPVKSNDEDENAARRKELWATATAECKRRGLTDKESAKSLILDIANGDEFTYAFELPLDANPITSSKDLTGDQMRWLSNKIREFQAG